MPRRAVTSPRPDAGRARSPTITINATEEAMVAQEESERPAEEPVSREPALARASRYVLVRNHVRELAVDERADVEKPASDYDSKPQEKKNKQKSIKYNSSAEETSPEQPRASNIALNEETEDFEELRNIYYECKQILYKIEQKYGDKLNLNENSSTDSEFTDKNKRKRHKRNHESRETSGGVCTCQKNTKIVFDESGNETTKSVERTDHICIHNSKPNSEETFTQDSVRIEYNTAEYELPEDVSELSKLLQTPQLEAPYRNAVVRKLRTVKQELLYTFKYHKSSLVDIVKEDPEELLEFRGTNLAELAGYS